MTLEKLMERSSVLAARIAETTNSVFVLQGHKNEVDYQIQLAQEEADELDSCDEVVVE